MFGRVPQNAAPFLGTRPNTSESHSEISTRVRACTLLYSELALTGLVHREAAEGGGRRLGGLRAGGAALCGEELRELEAVLADGVRDVVLEDAKRHLVRAPANNDG